MSPASPANSSRAIETLCGVETLVSRVQMALEPLMGKSLDESLPPSPLHLQACFSVRLAVLIAGLIYPTAPPALAQSSGQPLESGPRTERVLAADGLHVFYLTLTSAQYARVSVDPRGTAFLVRLSNPDASSVVEFESNPGQTTPLDIHIVAEVTGDYQLQIRLVDNKTPSGQYAITLTELRLATEGDRKRSAADAALTTSRQLMKSGLAASLRLAIPKLEGALPLWRDLGDRRGEGDTLQSIGEIYYSLREPRKALEYCEQALVVRRAEGYRYGEATVLNDLAVLYSEFGEKEKALDCYTQALQLLRETGKPWSEAITLANMGTVYGDLGEIPRALESFQKGLAIFREVRDRRGEASLLNSIAKAYDLLGQPQQTMQYLRQALPVLRELGEPRHEAYGLNDTGAVYAELNQYRNAIDFFEQAIQLTRLTGDRTQEAAALNNAARCYSLLGNLAKALQHYERALAISRESENRGVQASTLTNLGVFYTDRGDWAKALEYYQQALALRRSLLDRRGEAITLAEMGLALFRRGETEPASDSLHLALGLLREVGDRLHEARALAYLAQVELARNRPESALEQADAALAIHESIRATVLAQDLRVSYFSGMRDLYDLRIGILMRFHRERPEPRFDIQAFETSERARARGLLDMLREAHADIREGVEPALLDRERALQARLNVKSEQLVKVLGGKHTETESAAVEQQIRATVTEYQAVRADIRARSPRYSALAYPELLGVTNIQEQILDADTVLLEYALAGDHSYLWVVTPGAVVSHVLPPRREIKKMARLVYADWSTSVPPAHPGAPVALSRMLLGPAAGQLRRKRLLIVADGLLQYLPFAALPAPGAPHLPLAVQHEVVHLPSASILEALRRDRASRPAAPKLLGILADPVFDPNDPRVELRGKTELALDSDSNAAPPVFDRLRSTRREAEMLRSLVRSDNSKVALDFDANRSTMLSAEWRQYRILHIASHAFFNSTHPELSGLVLSMVDRSGRPQNGFLQMHELYNLKLGADLVVLSACQTALGQEIKGEGLVSLARGFMYAGATRVVASTWEVPEGATAELMRLFYKGMLQDRLRPAAALRAAQIAMSKNVSTSAPYYWAAFVLQGEYR